MPEEIPYLSNELELFEKAVNWKKYFSSCFKPFITGDVLEVGAGIGTTSPFLITASIKSYTCIEPDLKQAAIISDKINSGELPSSFNVQPGILESNIIGQYDTILYIDVIEHIQDDRGELVKAAQALRPGGHLCILVPANPNDYSSFDKVLGHYRRYNKKMLLDVLPASMELVWIKYLDVLGSVSSKMNKYFLKQSYPGTRQIFMWDKWMVPVSRVIDPLTGNNWGKSLLLVAKKK